MAANYEHQFIRNENLITNERGFPNVAEPSCARRGQGAIKKTPRKSGMKQKKTRVNAKKDMLTHMINYFYPHTNTHRYMYTSPNLSPNFFFFIYLNNVANKPENNRQHRAQ